MDRRLKILEEWRASLCERIDIASLHACNPIAHKWKATYRSMALRELVGWRVQDLASQSLELARRDYFLGAYILLRSAFEALAILIYVSEKTSSVVRGEQSFFEFDELTTRLVMGSKNRSTPRESINVLTVLGHCDKKYPGIRALYASLSESAHPNYEGMSYNYSKIDYENFITEFSNRWKENDNGKFLDSFDLCLSTFELEYNSVWPTQFEALERWLEENDSMLEAERHKF